MTGNPPSLIRLASEADVADILRVEEAAGRTAASESGLRAAIHDPDRVVVVALCNGDLAGWAKTHRYLEADGPAPAGYYLGGVTVDPVFRRRGLAHSLTQARLNWIWGRSDEAWYVTNSSNAASVALHDSFGFVEIARAATFHGTAFDGGSGVLLRAVRPLLREARDERVPH